jgi:hypothetical protein
MATSLALFLDIRGLLSQVVVKEAADKVFIAGHAADVPAGHGEQYDEHGFQEPERHEKNAQYDEHGGDENSGPVRA